ncbi:hypothetical protein N7E02_04835 (plasmid) [Aliirhizobium terrae]|uniref:hypothetical protein n=1 Tax=Terrirhizobium terrae TaxID=2926709 RepID=UPI002576553A|nr:hypothetical protein [Rhizobium sp. CC-CFT758]WJH38703.1 hypothetical protein N7E02_04835 [Rhizobium sp. CC-CFT758]
MSRFPSRNLQEVLEDRATLYSGSKAVRADLVARTLLAIPEIEVGLASNVEEDLFLLMDRLATDDERQCGIA